MSDPAEPTTFQRVAGRLPTALPAVIALALLAGCGTPTDKFPPGCPQLKLIRDTSDLTRVRGAGTDVTDLILDARIEAVPATCSDGPKGTVQAKIKVLMTAARGPAATGTAVTLPYLVTVALGEQLIEQQYFVASGAFPSNVDRVSVTGDDIELQIPVTAERAASAYTIYVSFRLTAAELAYNRSRRK
ncbi:MAG: hypothetical protein NT133_15790 [Alphaproteobacteria bacterium]|nr:hypothetical protein [Alphaproteobacteria bacterium]